MARMDNRLRIRRNALRWLLTLAVPCAALVSWEALARARLVESVLLPAPTAVLSALYSAGRDGVLLPDIAASLRRVAVGFVGGASLGVGVGVLYLFRWPRMLLAPLLELVRPIPPLAWIPLSLLWFGFGDRPAYFLVGLGAFFPVLSG